MLDPRIATAFRNAAATLRDQQGNPPSEERMASMLKKFEYKKGSGHADDASFLEAIGRGWINVET